MKRIFQRPMSIILAIALFFTLLQTGIVIPAKATELDSDLQSLDVTLSDWVLDEDNGFLYAISEQSSQLLFIRTDNFAVVKRISFDSFPTDIKLYNGKLWIPIEKAKQVVEIDISTQSIINTHSLQNEPIRIELFENTLFYTGAPSVPWSEQWSYVYAYDLTEQTETTVRGPSWCPNLAVDQVNHVLYVSDMHQVCAYSVNEYTEIGSTDYQLGFTYVKNRAHRMFFDGKSVYYAGKSFDPINLSTIQGTYGDTNEYTNADKTAVYYVKGTYIFTNWAVFDRDTYTKIADLPFETTLSLMDSQENVYLFNPDSNALVRVRLEFNYGSASRNLELPNGLQLEYDLREWVYDARVNKIYAITDHSNYILYIDADTMKVEEEKWIGSIPTDIELSEDNLYVALFGSTRVAITGTDLSSPVETVDLKTVPYRIAVDGEKLYYIGQDQWCDLYAYDFRNATDLKLDYYYTPDLVADRVNHIVYVGESGSSGSKLTAIRTTDDSVLGKSIAQFDNPGKLSISGADVYYQGSRYSLGNLQPAMGYYTRSIYGSFNHYVFTGQGIYDRDTYQKTIDLPFDGSFQVLVGNDNAVYFYSETDRTIVKYYGVQPYAASLTVSGEYEIPIPDTGTVTSPYGAVVLDQYGNILADTAAVWALEQTTGGVSIDRTTGVVTVGSAAQPGTITVKAETNGVSTLFTAELVKYTTQERRGYLSDLIGLGNQYLDTGWIWNNQQSLQSAVDIGLTALQNPSASMTELNAAVRELEAQINRAYLEDLVYTAQMQSPSDYTAQRWAAVESAAEYGSSVLGQTDPPSYQVNDAIEKLYFVLNTLPAYDFLLDTVEYTVTADLCTPKTWEVLQAALSRARILQLSPYWKYDALAGAAADVYYGFMLVNLDQMVAWSQDLLGLGPESFTSATWTQLHAATAVALTVQAKSAPDAEEVADVNETLAWAIVTAEMELMPRPQQSNCAPQDWNQYQTALQSASDLLESDGEILDQVYEVLTELSDAAHAIFTGTPYGLTPVAVSTAASSDGQIFGTTPLMEYKLQSDTEWRQAEGNVITGLPAGTYEIRYSEATGFEAGVPAMVTVSVLPSSDTEVPPFEDVSENSWYHDAVEFAAARGITKGTGDNQFSPTRSVTRGQFVVMLLRAYGIAPDEEPMDNFTDAGDAYYTNYLSAAKRLGISNGVGGNLFNPDAAISRQDMLTMLYRGLTVLNRLPVLSEENTLSDYGDADHISAYARQAMDTFVSTGIINGNAGMLNPFGITSRAEMTQVFYRLLSD